MTREEQIKQYCAEQGFPYGACSGISSVKAIVATDAIKWADEHPDGSMVKWHTGEPKENGKYLITTNIETVLIAWWNGTSWLIGNMSLDIKYKAWCKLSDIAPYKEENI